MDSNDPFLKIAIDVIGDLERIKRVGGIDDKELNDEIAELGAMCDDILAEWDRQDAEKARQQPECED